MVEFEVLFSKKKFQNFVPKSRSESMSNVRLTGNAALCIFLENPIKPAQKFRETQKIAVGQDYPFTIDGNE